MNEEEEQAIERLKEIEVNTYSEGKARAIDTVLNLIEKLQKENEELKDTNCLVKRYFKLKDTNTYLQKENDELKKQRNIEPILINNKMYFIDNEIYNELLEDIKSNYTSVQKVKDKIEEMQKEYNKLDKQVDEYINDENKDLAKYYENKEKISIMQTLSYFINTLKELIEGRK